MFRKEKQKYKIWIHFLQVGNLVIQKVEIWTPKPLLYSSYALNTTCLGGVAPSTRSYLLLYLHPRQLRSV